MLIKITKSFPLYFHFISVYTQPEILHTSQHIFSSIPLHKNLIYLHSHVFLEDHRIARIKKIKGRHWTLLMTDQSYNPILLASPLYLII